VGEDLERRRIFDCGVPIPGGRTKSEVLMIRSLQCGDTSKWISNIRWIRLASWSWQISLLRGFIGAWGPRIMSPNKFAKEQTWQNVYGMMLC